MKPVPAPRVAVNLASTDPVPYLLQAASIFTARSRAETSRTDPRFVKRVALGREQLKLAQIVNRELRRREREQYESARAERRRFGAELRRLLPVVAQARPNFLATLEPAELALVAGALNVGPLAKMYGSTP